MADSRIGRLVSLDAYRGLIMLTLAANGFGILGYANSRLKTDPDSALWQTVKFQTDHPKWVSNVQHIGVSYWDLIQPSFMFMVGVAMPFSYAKRLNRGDSYWKMFGHALFRGIVLVLLGVFLESTGKKYTNWHFPCVLSQIGLGYVFLFFLLGRPSWLQLFAGIAILAGFWAWFVATPVPDAPAWQNYAAHFGTDIKQINQNAAAYFDHEWLTRLRHWLTPQETQQYVNAGGYTTLNFVPSMVTMLLGLMCGELLQSERREGTKLAMLFVGGTVLMGLAMAAEPYCPIVKRIWTPSWVLFSGAYVLWILGLFYAVIDVFGWKRWSYPLVVLGVNSILLYLFSMLLGGWVRQQLQIHFGQDIFSGPYADIKKATYPMIVFWLICFWLYRQRLFVRI